MIIEIVHSVKHAYDGLFTLDSSFKENCFSNSTLKISKNNRIKWNLFDLEYEWIARTGVHIKNKLLGKMLKSCILNNCSFFIAINKLYINVGGTKGTENKTCL